MIQYIFVYAYIVLLFATAAIIWAMICNWKTFSQRQSLIPKIGDPLFFEKIERYRAVSDDKHFWYLITFRDPKPLYK